MRGSWGGCWHRFPAAGARCNIGVIASGGVAVVPELRTGLAGSRRRSWRHWHRCRGWHLDDHRWCLLHHDWGTVGVRIGIDRLRLEIPGPPPYPPPPHLTPVPTVPPRAGTPVVQIMPLKVPDIAMPSAVVTPGLRLGRKRCHAEQRGQRQGPTNNRFHGIAFFNVSQTNCAQVHTKLSTPQRTYSLT